MTRTRTLGRARIPGLIVAAVLLVAGCGQDTPSPSPDGSAPSSPGAVTTDAPSATTGPAASPRPVGQPPETSRQELIATALAEGRIDQVTALEYRAFALFGMSDLPAEFASADSRGDDAALFHQIVELLPGLSAADQDRLRRFVARPTEPDSVFAAGRQPVTAGLAGVAPVSDNKLAAGITECRDWVDSGAADTRFKVWACKGADDAAASRDIALVAGLMSAIWDPMTKAPPAGMGQPIADGTGSNVARELGGDGRIDIYLLAPGEGVYRDIVRAIPGGAVAAAVPSPPYVNGAGSPVKTSSGFMMVNRERIGDTEAMRRDLIHEFFHVLQNAHNRKGPFKGDQGHWFNEASATWAEAFYDRPTSAQVHTWFEWEFQLSPEGLESTEGPDHPYASYIWPLFMEQEVGASAVFKSWVAIEAAEAGDFKKVSDAIDGQLAFKTRFRDFAVRNLNTELKPSRPEQRRYVHLDGNFPDGAVPVPVQFGQLLKGTTYRSEPQSIEPLAAAYFELEPEGEARDVTFDLSGLSPTQALDGDVLLHIVDRWERRPIENGKLHLCRDRPADDFDRAYVVLSNHDRGDQAKAITGELLVRTKDACGQGSYVIDVKNVGQGNRPAAGHYEGSGRVICNNRSDGGWNVAAVYYVDDTVNPATDVLGFDVNSLPGSVAVTLVAQNVEGPGWFVDERMAGDQEVNVSVTDTPTLVTITAVGRDDTQDISISVTCSMVTRPG